MQRLILWRKSFIYEKEHEIQTEEKLEETEKRASSHFEELSDHHGDLGDVTLVGLEENQIQSPKIETSALISDAPKDRVEKEEEVEDIFSFFQVFTAAFQSFAHGANDTANAMYVFPFVCCPTFTFFTLAFFLHYYLVSFIFSQPLSGPYTAVYFLWMYGKPQEDLVTPVWALAAGGFGIVLGLATLGKPVMETIGSCFNLTKGARVRRASEEQTSEDWSCVFRSDRGARVRKEIEGEKLVRVGCVKRKQTLLTAIRKENNTCKFHSWIFYRDQFDTLCCDCEPTWLSNFDYTL